LSKKAAAEQMDGLAPGFFRGETFQVLKTWKVCARLPARQQPGLQILSQIIDI